MLEADCSLVKGCCNLEGWLSCELVSAGGLRVHVVK